MRQLLLRGMALLVVANAALGAGAPKATRRVIFMIDRSASMPLTRNPDGTPRLVRFSDETGAARRAAENILDDVAKSGETTISFYTFGNKDALAPDGPDAVDLTPADARSRLGEFFSADPAHYPQQRTYIAYSIFNLVRDQTGLGPSFTPHSDVPEDSSLLNVFVFTDGGEDNDAGFDNRPYEEWLKRHEKRLQVLWRRWHFFPRTQQEKEERDRIFSPSPADSVYYSVHFGVPTAAYSFSTLEPPANRTAPLDVSRLIRLIPAIAGEPLAEAVAAGAPACKVDTLSAPTPPSQLHVQAEVGWPDGSAATSEWPVSAPGREVTDVVSTDHATPVKTIGRNILELLIGGQPSVVLDTSAAPGRYPVRLIRDSLCEQLKRVYPASTFVFPVTDDGRLPPLGFISVENIPLYKFAISSQDGARPNDPLRHIATDRWQQVGGATRRLRVNGEPGVNARIDLTVLVRRGGKTDPAGAEMASLEAGSRTGGSISVAPGETFTLRVPSKPQSWLTSVLGHGFRHPEGDYEILLRVRPQLAIPAGTRHKTIVACENCDPARVLRTDEYVSLTLPVHIDPAPLTIVIIALALLLLVTLLWITVRWLTRPRFPKGLVVGNLLGESADLRAAHERGLKGMIAVYKRRPVFVDLQRQDERTIVSQDAAIDEKANVRRDLIALRPGHDRIHVWCVIKAGENETIELRGKTLDAVGEVEVPPEHRKLLQILHGDLKQRSDLIVKDDGGQVRTYKVQTLQ